MAPFKTIYQFAQEHSFLENIAPGPKGTLLVTRVDVAEVWSVDPASGNGTLVASVPNISSMTGICRLSESVYAVGVGNFSMTTGAQDGSWSLWLLDLKDGEPEFKQVAKMPEVGLINGIATFDESTVLVTDCAKGKVYKVNVSKSNSYELVLDDETMTVHEGAPMPIGINGIKVFEADSQKYVYYTTTTRATLFRIPVTADAKPAGPAEAFFHDMMSMDDFAIGPEGAVYMTTHNDNTVVRISPDGKDKKVLAGAKDKMDLAGATACILDETAGKLYVTTCGGQTEPVNGVTEAAKVVEIQL